MRRYFTTFFLLYWEFCAAGAMAIVKLMGSRWFYGYSLNYRFGAVFLDLPLGICPLSQFTFYSSLFRTAISHCAIPCCFSARTQLITNHGASSFAFCLDISKNIPLNHCQMSICKEISSRNGDITLTISLRLCYADVDYILFNICENQTICIMPYSRRVLISGDESEFMEPSNISFTSEQHTCQSKQSTPCFLFDDECKIITDTIIYVIGHFLYAIISSVCNCTILDAIWCCLQYWTQRLFRYKTLCV